MDFLASGCQLGLLSREHPCSVAQLRLTLSNPMDCGPQAPLSTGFSRQEYWSGLPSPPPGDLPKPGIHLLHWQANSLPLSHPGSTSNKLARLRRWKQRHLSSWISPYGVTNGLLCLSSFQTAPLCTSFPITGFCSSLHAFRLTNSNSPQYLELQDSTLCCAKSLQSCPTLWTYGLQPTRLLCPWDFPGKNTRVGCQVHTTS